MNKINEYRDFVKGKIKMAALNGLPCESSEINSKLFPHQRDIVQWAVQGGQRAIFASYGLGKTMMQSEIVRILHDKTGARALIVCPLGVRQEFMRDGALLGVNFRFIRRTEEVEEADGAYFLTNYESIRDGRLNPELFDIVSLDEASVLRSFGSKTYQNFLPMFETCKYKFVATATPAPNRYRELINYAGFLGIMDTGDALTRFFQRDSTKANNLTLYPHKETEFWLWMHSWAIFLQKPSELGYSDEGYNLPPLKVIYHEVGRGSEPMTDKDGQNLLFAEATLSLRDAAHEKRVSLDSRIGKMMEIIRNDPESHYIIWHDLEAERHAIEKALPECRTVYGTQDLEEREKIVEDFAEGRIKYFASKPELSGSGCNLQRHCHKAIFLGIGYKFNDFAQSIHRIYRFLQDQPCEIHVIYAESENEVLNVLKDKWTEYDKLMATMSEVVAKYGLSKLGTEVLKRDLGVTRRVEKGEHFEVALNDCVEEAMLKPENSVDEIITSIPFSTQYEYASNYNDMGHNDDNAQFWKQMDFLTPELLRILRPGRICCIHIKDRILFGNVTGAGAPTVSPLHAETIFHFMRHGFDYMGMITVITDVVRENNQTYRLGWTEDCKDGTKMGVGMPEYVLIFRKPQTDRTRGYADVPVTHGKDEYSRARWQVDAHAFWRTDGNRLSAKKYEALSVGDLGKMFRNGSRGEIYDYGEHVKLGEDLDRDGKLPATFMAIAPGSWHPDVWDDVNRMLSLNGEQARRNLTLHLCLAKGSLVLTRKGFKPIELINVGDFVLTHKGNWKRVIAKAYTGINPVVQTKAQGVPLLITTPNHKLWTRKNNKTRAIDYLSITEPTWIEAKDTKGSWVNLKLPEIKKSALSASDWWLVGRYLADGHMGTRGDFFVSIGKKKIKEFEFHAGKYIGSFADGTARQYRLSTRMMAESLVEMLGKCGKGAENKQIPIEGLCLNAELSEALLSGYLSGDGCSAGNAVMACSVSRALLLGMAMVAQRARGVIASVFAGKPAGKHIIEGREVNQLQLWVMSWRKGSHFFGRILADDGAWKKVRDVKDKGKAETWSLQVEDDASYTAEGCIVKNCPLQFDIVDRLIERYSNPGELIYDPFGGLMTVPYRAILMGRCGGASELCESYFDDGVKYLRRAEAEQAVPSLFGDLEEEEEQKAASN